jgi:hypothetical protein
MEQLTDKQLLALLVKVVYCTVQDYYYFPDVIIAGRQKIEREEFLFLFSEGYIAFYKADSFGRFYKHTAKAESYMAAATFLKHTNTKKKAKTIRYHQGQLNFA